MKEFLYVLRVTRPEMLTEGPTAVEAAITETHFRYLQELAEQGVMILVGRTLNNDADAMGLAIFRAESESEARSIMENDPAIIHGIMRGTLFPYRIALMQGRPIR